MKILILALFTCLAFASATSSATAANYYTHITCANGFADAYTITQIDISGCIIRIVGTNCQGVQTDWTPTVVVIVTADPGGTYDDYVADGATAYVKIKYNLVGGIYSVWGRKANGDYYTT